jgi:hypothetical protein
VEEKGKKDFEDNFDEINCGYSHEGNKLRN